MQFFINVVYNKEYGVLKPTVHELIERFNIEGQFLYNGGLFTVKYFPLSYLNFNIK